jgi:hypothetical protein
MVVVLTAPFVRRLANEHRPANDEQDYHAHNAQDLQPLHGGCGQVEALLGSLCARHSG